MVIIGKKKKDIKYDFRETCFGICYKNNEIYLTEKRKEVYLIGGGIEKGESDEECLKREFLEETGLEIAEITKLCDIDCFWYTKNKKNMESLTHIYIVEITEHINTPLEAESKLIKMSLNKAKEALELPYQKRALEEFEKYIDN